MLSPLFKLSMSLLSAALILFQFDSAFAKDATVFEAKRPLSFENNQQLPKDYFINAGKNDGVKIGMVFKVLRRQSLYDAYQQKSPEELVVPVGELRIIHVQGDISVARMEEVYGRDKLPTLEFDEVMVGDRVDLSSGKMGSTKTASLDMMITPIVLDAPTGAKPETATTATAAAADVSGSADISSKAPQALTTSQPL